LEIKKEREERDLNTENIRSRKRRRERTSQIILEGLSNNVIRMG
jgi:hypothetical protein